MVIEFDKRCDCGLVSANEPNSKRGYEVLGRRGNAEAGFIAKVMLPGGLIIR